MIVHSLSLDVFHALINSSLRFKSIIRRWSQWLTMYQSWDSQNRCIQGWSGWLCDLLPTEITWIRERGQERKEDQLARVTNCSLAEHFMIQWSNNQKLISAKQPFLQWWLFAGVSGWETQQTSWTGQHSETQEKQRTTLELPRFVVLAECLTCLSAVIWNSSQGKPGVGIEFLCVWKIDAFFSVGVEKAWISVTACLCAWNRQLLWWDEGCEGLGLTGWATEEVNRL